MSCDMIAVSVSCLLILLYYLYLQRRTRRSPNSSVHALNALTRERWAKMIVSNGKMEILAIPTLRNSAMAASFMATTAMLLIIGLLNLSEKIGQWAQNLQPLLATCQPLSQLWQIKFAALLLCFVIAFYYFAMAIRFFNHVGYLINLPCDSPADGDVCKKTYAYLNKAGSYYTFGTRAFFFSLPILFWFFGPLFLVLATLGLIAGLAALDSVPK